MNLVALLLLFFLFPMKVQALESELERILFPDEITEDMKYIMASNDGQLGNACFMAATGISYALDNGCAFVIDSAAKKKYPEVFQRFPEYSVEKPKRELSHWANKLYYSKITKSSLITGCPNSDFWFMRHKDVVVELLGPTEGMKRDLQEKYSEYLRKDKKYVGLHLRTFVQKGEAKNYYPIGTFQVWGICPEYYEEAMSLFPEDSVFVVFSDNIELAKKLLSSFDKEFIFQNDTGMIEDFYLMSMMERMIIPSSTFAAFACFLNTNPNKIVVKPENTPAAHMLETNWVVLKSKHLTSGVRNWHKICRREYQRLGFNK